jgi:benzoyl-CoA reductase/2-hydroxyglutaryl-CoA dehydratase subunit BcrC/BadD/HgdB
MSYFSNMVQDCYEYATQAKAQGRAIVGIMCEYTPRELIMAANAVPVCLCGGSLEMIAPAEEHLPANLCPLIKSTYGYHLQGTNPFLEMADLLVAETTCDGKKKMYELMGRTRELLVLELPQKPDEASAFTHWISELRQLKGQLEERLGVTITEDALRQAIGVMNEERQLRRQLADLMRHEKPVLTGCQLLELKSIISGIPADRQQYTDALAHFKSLPGSDDLGSRVRVLLTGVPIVHGAERVVQLIEDAGGLVVCMESCTGIKPIWDDVDEGAEDPLQAIAEKYFHLPCSVMTPNQGRLDLITECADRYSAQCIVDLSWQACLTYDVESFQVKHLAETKLELPYLKISTDYSPADSARLALRIEALFETVG